MKIYLIFDASCPVCGRLAAAIEAEADGRLEAISIRSSQAKDLLDQAHPEGWTYAPYLVTVSEERTRAWTGIPSSLYLLSLLGARRAWRVWNVARKSGVVLPPGSMLASRLASRRLFLTRSAGGLGAAFLATLGMRPLPVSACVPCDSCGTRAVIVGCTNCSCFPYPISSALIYDYYDSYTGEYCYRASGGCACGTQCA